MIEIRCIFFENIKADFFFPDSFNVASQSEEIFNSVAKSLISGICFISVPLHIFFFLLWNLIVYCSLFFLVPTLKLPLPPPPRPPQIRQVLPAARHVEPQQAEDGGEEADA